MNKMKSDKFELACLVIILIVLVFGNTFVSGQSPYFRSIKLPVEAQQTTITCLYQDNFNYLWIGTGNGLLKYDGNDFAHYESTDKQSSLQVTALCMTPDQVLWIGTRKGAIFQLKGDSLQPFAPQEGNPKVAITGFATDKSGNLWFSTYGEGVYYYDGKRIHGLNSDDGLTDNYCYTLKVDAHNRIWVATDGGISICSAGKSKKVIRKITTSEGLPDNIVLSLDYDGVTMWVGMQDAGICKSDPNTFQIIPQPTTVKWEYGPVNEIVTGKNWLWLSSEQNGIISIDSPTGLINGNYQGSDNLSITRISNLYSDKQGNYWVASGNQLFLSLGHNLLQYAQIGQISGKNIHSILTCRNGCVWFSNDNGLFKIDKKIGRAIEIKIPLQKHTQIISLFEDEQGYIWAGTFGNGIFCIEPGTNKIRLFGESDGLSNGNILSISGKGNQIWLATLGGAYSCNINGNPFLSRSRIRFTNDENQHFPSNNYIYSVFIDSRNRIWFGTDGKGIYMLQNGNLVNFDKSRGLKSNNVYSITEDSDGHIWFSTANEGIYRYDGKILRNYSLKDGLSDLHITGLLADKKHHLLVVNNNGVDILDIRNNIFLYYSSGVGMSEINPDLNVCSLEGDNIAWIGTQKGLFRLQIPEDIFLRQPSLQLNKVSVFLGKENYLATHSFSHNQNHISFHFNALWYVEPALVSYQIRLKGYDIDWIDTRNNMVTYSNLLPGTYTFEVRASIKGSFEQSQVKSYVFTIKKPFWKSTWVILTFVIVIILLVFLIVNWRENTLKRRDAIEREKIMFQFQTLRSQVNPHFLFNSFSTLISIIDENKEVAIDYVEKLSLFFRNILEYREKDLIPLSEEIKLIETYYYLQKQRYCDNLNLEINVNSEILHTLIPPMVLQMLVENAIKHSVISAEKPLSVEILSDGNHITVINNLQRKKDKEPSTGIGLTNIRNRYNLLGFGEIRIDSTTDRFIVQLPIIYPEK
jgi:ligand-binding sensor domain-containing protein